MRQSQVSAKGKQVFCSSDITGIKVFLKGKKSKAELALVDHQPFLCYFKGDSESFYSAWTKKLQRL